MKQLTLSIIVIALLGFGCRSIGPGKVTRDRFNYSQALADSWKSQMLLNIVKVRYLDLPIFLDVGQVVSSYSLETTVDLGGSFSSAFNSGSLGAQGRYTDRPTITYMPLTGEEFLKGILIPIRPVNVFSLIQSGYAADFILELCLDSFNGLYNRPATLASKRQPNEAFFQVLSLLREVQDAGALGMKIVQPQEGELATVIFFRQENVAEEIRAKAAKVRQLLQLDPGQMEYRLVYSPLPGKSGELGIGTRSLWQILAAMAMGITIPESHRERRIVPPLREIDETESALLRVHSGHDEPKDCFVAIHFEDEWFWIANDDWRSKRTFSSILFLFTLTDKGGAANLPVITIPSY